MAKLVEKKMCITINDVNKSKISRVNSNEELPIRSKGGNNQQLIDNDNVLSISHFTSITRLHWNAYAPARVPSSSLLHLSVLSLGLFLVIFDLFLSDVFLRQTIQHDFGHSRRRGHRRIARRRRCHRRRRFPVILFRRRAERR